MERELEEKSVSEERDGETVKPEYGRCPKFKGVPYSEA